MFAVYELYRGRRVGTFHTSQEALDCAHREYADVPDEAGVVVVSARTDRKFPEVIDDVADLVATGSGIVWRLKP